MVNKRVGRDPQDETGERSTGNHPGLRCPLSCEQWENWGCRAEADVGTGSRMPLGGCDSSNRNRAISMGHTPPGAAEWANPESQR